MIEDSIRGSPITSHIKAMHVPIYGKTPPLVPKKMEVQQIELCFEVCHSISMKQ